ncbi:LysR family transcriptional regulator [Xenorhabdus sp. KK7.4]|uniref:LysR family transcriptional regulator n=1 Tax=Xenorhabdus sp. KK7.4 TaxID=1851572 RepID=UPI00187CFE73|nr:LysR family transcriptional regulator [Xenorhabdus sp. KK7.4]
MKIRNLDDLVVLLKVVDCNGFSAAARALDLAPATVSKQIARLERALSTRLFDRTTRQLRITDEGCAIVKRVRSALEQLDNVVEIAQQGTETLSGMLRITAPVSLGSRYIAPLIAIFQECHPGLKFDLRLSDQIVDIYSNDIDLAIRIGHLNDSQLIIRRLTDSRRILVASPSYLNQHGSPVHPEELCQHQCLLFTYPGLRQNHWILRHCGQDVKIENVKVNGNLRSDNGSALRAWSRAGLGISLREIWDVADELRSGVLIHVLPEWFEPEKPIHVVRTLRSPVPLRVSAFVEFLVEQWQPPPWDRP